MGAGIYFEMRAENFMSKLGKLNTYADLVKTKTGKSKLRQFLEIIQLSRGRQRLGVEEYYELGVFDDMCFPGQAKASCVGW